MKISRIALSALVATSFAVAGNLAPNKTHAVLNVTYTNNDDVPHVNKKLTFVGQNKGKKIVITTDKAQTTRKRIKGIYTTEQGQIVFIDTPGVHKPLNKLGEFLLDEAKIAVPDADLILFLVDGSEPAGKGDKWIAQNILQTDIPVIIVMNKVDKIKKMGKIEQNLLSYKTLFEKNYPV